MAEPVLVPSWLTKPLLQTILCTKYGQNTSTEIQEFSVHLTTKKGDTFGGDIFRICIQTTAGKEYSLIAKKPYAEAKQRNVVEAYNFYGKEIKFYTKYSTKFQEILKSVHEHEEIVPELIYCDVDEQLLVLNDLRPAGFIPGNRESRLDRETAQIVMRKLAKLHAASIILNQQLNGELEKDPFDVFSIDGPFRGAFKRYFIAVLDEAKKWGQGFKSICEKLKKIEGIYAEVAHQATISKRGLNVLVHGDLWYTNVLVKKAVPKDVQLIDFQFIGWASLTTDLLHFIFRSLNEEDYQNGFDYLVEIYHSELARVLHKLQYHEIPTLEDIKMEIHDHLFHGKQTLFKVNL